MMKTFTFKIESSNNLIKRINININQYKTIDDIKNIVSDNFNLPTDQFTFKDPPKDIGNERTFQIVIKNPSSDVSFELPNKNIIIISDCTNKTLDDIIDSLTKQDLCYSSECIKKNFEFNLFGIKIPHNTDKYFSSVPKGIYVSIQLINNTITLNVYQNVFTFSEEETISKVSEFIKKKIGYERGIVNIYRNSTLLKDNDILRLGDEFESIGLFIIFTCNGISQFFLRKIDDTIESIKIFFSLIYSNPTHNYTPDDFTIKYEQKVITDTTKQIKDFNDQSIFFLFDFPSAESHKKNKQTQNAQKEAKNIQPDKKKTVLKRKDKPNAQNDQSNNPDQITTQSQNTQQNDIKKKNFQENGPRQFSLPCDLDSQRPEARVTTQSGNKQIRVFFVMIDKATNKENINMKFSNDTKIIDVAKSVAKKWDMNERLLFKFDKYDDKFVDLQKRIKDIMNEMYDSQLNLNILYVDTVSNAQTKQPPPSPLKSPRPPKEQKHQPRETDEPKTREAYKPKTREAYKPKTREAYKPKTREADEPKTRETDKPKTRETDEPKTREAYKPKIRETDKPKTRETDKPKTRETDKPKTRETPSPADRHKQTEKQKQQEKNPTPASPRSPQIKQTPKKMNKYRYQTNVDGATIFVIELDSSATVKTFKKKIQEDYKVSHLSNIKVLFAGKDLLDDINLESLNIGDLMIYIYIRSQQDILLMTAKALIVPADSEYDDDDYSD